MDDYQVMIMNEDFQIVYIVDGYKSFIWTDRYYEAGDFEIYIPFEVSLLEFFKIDYYIWYSKSEHYMIINSIKITSDADEGTMMIVTGQSLESILLRRIVLEVKKWESVPVQDFLQEVLESNFIHPSGEGFFSGREIVPDNRFQFDRSDDYYIVNTKILYDSKGDTNLYDILVPLLTEAEIGFKITVDMYGVLHMTLYRGEDRSFQNPYISHVEFSESFENIISIDYQVSEQNYKNAIFVSTKYEKTEGDDLLPEAVEEANRLLHDFYRNKGVTIPSPQPYIPPPGYEDASPLHITNNIIENNSNFLIDPSGDWSKTRGKYFPFLEVAKQNSYMVNGELKFYYIYKWALTTDYGFKSYAEYLSHIKIAEQGDKGPEAPIISNERLMIESWEGGATKRPKYLNRREGYATASEVQQKYTDEEGNQQTTPKSEMTKQLSEFGSRALSENEPNHRFEGQIDGTGVFQYDIDFFMGDIVQISSAYGIDSSVRVTEFIWSIDDEGVATYPMLQVVKDMSSLKLEGEEVNT